MPFLGVPVVRILVFWGEIRGTPILENPPGLSVKDLGSDPRFHKNHFTLPWFPLSIMGTSARLLLFLNVSRSLAADVCGARSTSLMQLDRVNGGNRGVCKHVVGFTCGTEGAARKDVQSSDLEVSPLTCPLCPKHSSAPILYGIERTDGLGQRIYQILIYMATAAYHNMTFGGFVFNTSFDGGHGMGSPALMSALSAYVGSNYSKLRLAAKHPHFDACWNCRGEPDDQLPVVQAGQSVLGWLGCDPMEWATGFLGSLSSSFLQQLRGSTQLLRHPVRHFPSTGGLRVVVHLRRGDVMNTTKEGRLNRFVPDSFYLKFLRLLKPVVAPAKIHVFSAKEGIFSDADFDGYRQLGAQVHLDGGAVEDWAHMAQADVLVVAPSSYSAVAGILNTKCVLAFASHPFEYHPRWIQLDDDFGNLGELRACLLKL